jgi:hypothetical protein
MAENQVPDVQAANAYLDQQALVPAFFEKLAAYDIRPQNEADAQELLKIGAYLMDAEAKGMLESGAHPLLKAASQQLSVLLPESNETEAQRDARIKSSSFYQVQDPNLAIAADIVGEALAAA